ncbi:MAG: transposase [Coriobacteriales bacterium]|jgi:REP element-mobilizing transposase RayT|nr:transposase [Coriobacteriales bacterium]
MPRSQRQQGALGVYHVIFRGIAQQLLFEEAADYDRFIQTLKRFKQQSAFALYAFCLMNNHVHLLLKVNAEPLGTSLQRIMVSYSAYFNEKYHRRGHLFENRFKSEAVEDETYFLAVLRYIHLNPLVAGICAEPAAYPYSSYLSYLQNNGPDLVDQRFVKGLFAGQADFISFHEDIASAQKADCLDIRPAKLTDQEVVAEIRKLSSCASMSEFQKLAKADRDTCLSQLRKQGITIRQLARVSGLGYGIVSRCIKNVSNETSL